MTRRGGSRANQPRNHIAEFYGHRVYPSVSSDPAALTAQHGRQCPFLSAMAGEERECTKTSKKSHGVCTISSMSNGSRQDWPVCPLRVLDPSLLKSIARTLFGYSEDTEVLVVSPDFLREPRRRESLTTSVVSGVPAVVFFHEKLGGEIDLPESERSPHFKVDVTMNEVVPCDNGIQLGRYGLLEIQTMDFHGSYGAARDEIVSILEDGSANFADALEKRPELLGKKVEGPNKSNVFKRTFYQMMFKFQIGRHKRSAGCVFAIPKPVWDSWQIHLGNPELVPRPDGTWQLRESDELVQNSDQPPAWIYVFDLDPSSTYSPNKIDLWRIIATDAKTLSHYALEVAPHYALEPNGPADQFANNLQSKISKEWPELSGQSDSPQESLF